MFEGFTFYPRSTWETTARPVNATYSDGKPGKPPKGTLISRGTAPRMPWSTISRVAIHYTAAVNLPDGDPGESTDIASYIRSIQADYSGNRGYSIGYNFVVDYLGRIWEARGYDIKCAANEGNNDTTIAILVLVDGADAAKDVMISPIKAIIAGVRERAGRDIWIGGHRELPGAATACPGDGVIGQLHSIPGVNGGVFNPWYTPTQPVPPTLPPLPPIPQIILGDDDMVFIAKSQSIGSAVVLLGGEHPRMYGFTVPTQEPALIKAGVPVVQWTDAEYNDFAAFTLFNKNA